MKSSSLKKPETLKELSDIICRLVFSLSIGDPDRMSITAVDSLATILIARENLTNAPAGIVLYMSILEDIVKWGTELERLNQSHGEGQKCSGVWARIFTVSPVKDVEITRLKTFLVVMMKSLQPGADAILAHLANVGIYVPMPQEVIAA